MNFENPRLVRLNQKEVKRGADSVFYWMQRAQRPVCNPALNHAIDCANGLELPLTVIFCIMPYYPEANSRHFSFMLDGMRELWPVLRRTGADVRWAMPDNAGELARLFTGAALVVCDGGYLRHQRQWRHELALCCDCAVHEIDSETIVPVRVASDHAEYSAATIRRKINSRLPEWLHPAPLPY